MNLNVLMWFCSSEIDLDFTGWEVRQYYCCEPRYFELAATKFDLVVSEPENTRAPLHYVLKPNALINTIFAELGF